VKPFNFLKTVANSVVVKIFVISLVLLAGFVVYRLIHWPSAQKETLMMMAKFAGDRGDLKEAIQEALQHLGYETKSGWMRDSQFTPCDCDRLDAVYQGSGSPDRAEEIQIRVLNRQRALGITVAIPIKNASANPNQEQCLQGTLRDEIDQALVRRRYTQVALLCPEEPFPFKREEKGSVSNKKDPPPRIQRAYTLSEGEVSEFVWQMRDYLLEVSAGRLEREEFLCFFWENIVINYLNQNDQKITSYKAADLNEFDRSKLLNGLKQFLVPKEGGFLRMTIKRIVRGEATKSLEPSEAFVKIEFQAQLSSGEVESSWSMVLQKRAGEIRIRTITVR
jgi:hypothetical protein